MAVPDEIDPSSGFIDLVERAEELVKDRMKDNDPSHDWHHVHRVRLMALSLSRCESLHTLDPIDPIVLELAALFHDLCDKKCLPSSRSPSSAPVTAQEVLSPFFAPYLEERILKEIQVKTVYNIVDSVSWSKEETRRSRLSQRQHGEEIGEGDQKQIEWENQCGEFWCVSDADRLDAIGSIGIMRVSAYSAVKNRPLHIPPANPQNDSNPPAEQAEGYNASALAHFHSKLLKIKGDRLRTDIARREADRRQTIMESFLTELDFEWLVADQGAKMSLFT